MISIPDAKQVIVILKEHSAICMLPKPCAYKAASCHYDLINFNDKRERDIS